MLSVATLLTAQSLSPRDSAVHALNRLAYGPRPGDVDRVARGGVMRWIDEQLAPERIDDAALATRERQFDLLNYSREDLAASTSTPSARAASGSRLSAPTA